MGRLYDRVVVDIVDHAFDELYRVRVCDNDVVVCYKNVFYRGVAYAIYGVWGIGVRWACVLQGCGVCVVDDLLDS